MGLKVIYLKGYPNEDKKNKLIDIKFVLFDDGKTYLQLEELDYYYCYHDCSMSAREINVYSDKLQWEKIKLFPDSDYKSF